MLRTDRLGRCQHLAPGRELHNPAPHQPTIRKCDMNNQTMADKITRQRQAATVTAFCICGFAFFISGLAAGAVLHVLFAP
jgi:hypothetical protein